MCAAIMLLALTFLMAAVNYIAKCIGTGNMDWIE
jgi:hypothetical protein